MLGAVGCIPQGQGQALVALLLVICALGLAARIRRRGSVPSTENHRFRTLADAAFEGLAFERAGRITDVNRAMCQLTGSSSTTLIGLKLDDLIPGVSSALESADGPVEQVVLLPDGQTRPVEVFWRADPDNRGHVVAVRALNRQASVVLQTERACSDPLTGLANREVFEQHLRKALALSDRATGGIALLHVDLDRFGKVIEAFGLAASEHILIQTARRLTGTIKGSDAVARLCRDEFIILQSSVNQPSDATVLADRIIAEMAVPFLVDEHPFTLTASVGIALCPCDGIEPRELIANAALALRQAKQDGRGRWRHFEPGMDRLLRTRRLLDYELRHALTKGQFSLDYQPFVAIEGRKIAGYEALIRWNHPERGRISPAEFIPLAERSGLIVAIGIWGVLATACAEAASWDDPVIISVNLSPAQFVQPGIVNTVDEVLRRTGLPPSRLELEITEGTLMDDTQNALRILTALKALGVKIAMDDFGTGYSSLSYLRKFPFDKIKIDRSFISDVEDDSEAATIVHTIIAMSRSLRLDVTAEGVETAPQLAMLKAHGCTFAQGFLLGRPCPADQLAHHTKRGQGTPEGERQPILAASVGARS